MTTHESDNYGNNEIGGTAPQPQPQPAINAPNAAAPVAAQPSPVALNIDKVDEVAGYLSLMRCPISYVSHHLPFVVVPESMKLLDLEKSLPNPSRIREKHVFTDVASFIGYFKQYAPKSSPKLFAKRTPDSFEVTCIFDYHTEVGEGYLPHWGNHIAILRLAYDADFAHWLKLDNVAQVQASFAEFVEEYTHVFKQPDGATMLELAQELQGLRSVKFTSGKRLSNGQQKLEYIEELNAGTGTKGEVRVPESIIVNLSVFQFIPAQELKAAFRWRLGGDGKITFAYKFLQLRAALDAAIEAVAKTVSEQTDLQLFYTAS